MTIVKKYEMKATEIGGKMGIEMSGEGTLTFDAKAGLPKKMDYKGMMTISQSNVSVKCPITLTYEQTDGKPVAPPAIAGAPTKPASSGSTPATPSASPQPRPSIARPTRAAKPDAEFVPVASRGGKLSVAPAASKGERLPIWPLTATCNLPGPRAAGPCNGSRPI